MDDDLDSDVPIDDGLNDKQRRFVDEYLIDLNASAAAVRAGYTPCSSRQRGHLLKKNPSIQKAIAQRMEVLADGSGITVERVLREIARIAFAEITDVVYVEHGEVHVTETSDLTADQRAAIAEISQSHNEFGGTIRVRAHDKIRALELLGKRFVMFGEERKPDEAPLVVAPPESDS